MPKKLSSIVHIDHPDTQSKIIVDGFRFLNSQSHENMETALFVCNFI